jgi:tetratricopeptide (TPR) repeat protein
MVRNTFIYIIIFFLTFTNISSQEIKGLSGFSKQDDLDPTMKLELQKIGRDVINFLRWKRLPQAEKKLKEYESLQSTTDEFFYLRSAVNFTKKQLNLSESDLKTTLAINAKHEAAYYLIGMVYGIWSDWNRSKEAFKVAVELSPFNPHYFNNLAIAHYMLGEYEQARIAITKAIEQKANFTDAKILLIQIDRKLNKMDSAYKNAEKLYKDDGKNSEVKYLFTELIFESRQDYQKVIQLIDKERNLPISSKRILAQSYDFFMQENQSESIWKDIVESGLATDEDRKKYLNILIKLNKMALADKYSLEYINQDSTRATEVRSIYESTLKYNFAMEKFYYFFPISK